MGVKKSYVVTQDFKSPFVVSTGLPHKPQEIKWKRYYKGDTLNGELHMSNGQPAFVLVDGVIPAPASALKELNATDIKSNADGDTTKSDTPSKPVQKKLEIKYIDGIFLGALAGIGITYYLEKNGTIQPVEGSPYQNKLIGAVAGSLIGCYLIYRFKNTKPPVAKTLSLKE